jgi:hypothetical protein
MRSSKWVVRLFLLAVLFSWPNAPKPLVALGPPQTAQTQRPVVCTHTRLTDEVEPWKVLRTLEMVREMGAATIVEYFPWAYHEAQNGRFDWGHADMVVDFARHQGLTVIARLGGLTPAWARPAESTDTFLAAEDFDEFGDYVAEFVAHFKGRIQHVIIWNEPNVTLEWGFRPVDPEGYTELLKTAYTRAKAASPDVLVLGGALAPTLEPEGSDLAMNDLVYLERMYGAGAAGYFDILAAHSYGLSFPPDEPPALNAINFRRIELVRTLMDAHGDSGKPILITESGWNDSPRWTRAVKPGARIEYTLGGYQWAEDHWPTVQAVCTWAFRYPAPQYSYGDYFTLVTPDFQPKPIYEAIKEWARK